MSGITRRNGRDLKARIQRSVGKQKAAVEAVATANIGQTPQCLPDIYVGGFEFLAAAIWEWYTKSITGIRRRAHVAWREIL